ncbi:ABC transporter 7, partial [Candida parapsilosis]
MLHQSSRNGTSSCEFWDYDDITKCARLRLDYYPPLLLTIVSFAILFVKSLISYNKKRRGGQIKLPDDSRPLLTTTDNYGATNISTTDDQKLTKEDLKALHFDLARLPDTNIDGSPHGYIKEVFKNTSERLRVSVEYVLVILSLGLHLSPLVNRKLGKEFRNTHVVLAQLIFWVYLFIIVTIRVINMKRVAIRLPNLWIHTTALYFFNIFPALLTFRSALITTTLNKTGCEYYIFQFVIAALLLALNLTATVGDKPSQLYIVPGVEPNPENISSIASFISYSWLDKMVWSAYKQPLKLRDIWGLREDDYALYVLKGFEASKTTLRFTYKIFFHFKYLFAIQAFWAIVESML